LFGVVDMDLVMCAQLDFVCSNAHPPEDQLIKEGLLQLLMHDRRHGSMLC